MEFVGEGFGGFHVGWVVAGYRAAAVHSVLAIVVFSLVKWEGRGKRTGGIQDADHRGFAILLGACHVVG